MAKKIPVKLIEHTISFLVKLSIEVAKSDVVKKKASKLFKGVFCKGKKKEGE